MPPLTIGRFATADPPPLPITLENISGVVAAFEGGKQILPFVEGGLWWIQQSEGVVAPHLALFHLAIFT